MLGRFGWSNTGGRRREGVPGAFGKNGRAPEHSRGETRKSLAQVKDEKFGLAAGLLSEATAANRSIQSAADDAGRAAAERDRDEAVTKASRAIQDSTCLSGGDSSREQAWFLQYLGDFVVAGTRCGGTPASGSCSRSSTNSSSRVCAWTPGAA